MVRGWRLLIVLAAIAGVMVVGAAQAADPPLWVRHVQNFDGGISIGPRARLEATGVLGSGFTAAATIELNNVQMNADGDPPLPQDETSVAYKVSNPLIAVAAANDFVGDGYWIGRTTNGGRTWASTF
ncbi:MAG TPA: hypothetical protein VGQ84_12475, partial [Gaiellaceae bacterium]|nr:hypothetical protein [Gaiellaceae bacterium]